MLCLAVASGLMAARSTLRLVCLLNSLPVCTSSASCGLLLKVSSRNTPPAEGRRKPAATSGLASSCCLCSRSASSVTAFTFRSGLSAAELNFSVAGQSTRFLGSSSHSKRSALR